MSRARIAIAAMFLMAAAAPAQEKRAQFEVASVKPNTSGSGWTMIRPPVGGRFTATNARLRMLVALAYNVQSFEISGGPSWADSAGFDIEAKAADSKIGIEELRPLLQSLLEDRFQIKVHRETREVPVYALMAAKNGLKLPDAKEGGCKEIKSNEILPPPSPGAPPPNPCGGFIVEPGHVRGGKVSMAQLVKTISDLLGRPVIDKTGFTGTFDVSMDFSPEGTALFRAAPGPQGFDTSGPSLFTALQDQLGLKLEPQKGPEEMIVIDHAEKPSEN